jgi:alpha-amylase
MSHDTQPTQLLATPFESWFLPHAYCLILLRACPSLPCIFHGHLYGIAGPEPQPSLPFLPLLMQIRHHFAYGLQHNYWDNDECIGWTRVGREGNDEKEGCAVVLNIGRTVQRKKMFFGEKNKGQAYKKIVGVGKMADVHIGEDGMGSFEVGPRDVGVWIKREQAESFV